MSGFAGFDPGVRDFLIGLEADNSKAYFDAHRGFFDASIRDEMQALLDQLSERFGGEVKLFRQNRDIRFSPDKSPYKTNTYGIVRGSSLGPQGLYASISARGLVAGSGYHVMARDQLERYRAAVDDQRLGAALEELAAEARVAGLELWGDSLATAPRGYPKDHPRIELLRRKSLALGATRVERRPWARGCAGLRLRDMARGRASDRLARCARRGKHDGGASARTEALSRLTTLQRSRPCARRTRRAARPRRRRSPARPQSR